MKISLSILLLAISTLLLSQNDTTYNYNYPYDWPYDCNTMLYLDSCYYLAGDVGRIKDGCANVVYGFHISKIDSTGIKDTTVVFDNCEETNYIGWKGSLKNKNGNLYILGQKYPSIGNNKLFISKINPVYDTISITNFMDDTITKRAFSFVFDDSENMIFAGTIDSSYNEMSGLPETTYTKSLLFKASLSGEIIWQRSYSFGDISDGCWSSITRVLPAYDKGYIAIGRTSDLGN
ncbi:MAG: hypothetical protein C0596_18820 [Marinilabiliales bacterium]|nr:MAG: hypothetical protein C0596_18820 [Marinilabiliales bacterium]